MNLSDLSSRYKNCANCNVTFNDTIQKSINIVMSNGNTMESEVNVHILDAFVYIYGLSVQDFYVDCATDLTDGQKLNSDKADYVFATDKNIGLCYNCCMVFSNVYDFYKRFSELSHKDSLLNGAIKNNRSFVKNVKVEKNLELTEEVICDTDLFEPWNNKDEHISLGKGHKRRDYFITDYEQISTDIKNIIPERNTVSNNEYHTTKRKRGRPSKDYKANIKVSFKMKATEKLKTSKSKTGLQSLQFQPYVRLTRAKPVTSSAISESNYTVSSGDEDLEDGKKTARKTKRGFKRRITSTSSNCRNKAPGKNNSHHGTSELNHNKLLNCSIKSEISIVKSIKEEESDFSTQLVQESLTKHGCTKTRRSSGGRAVYVCNICGEGVTRVKSFRVHMNSHKKAANKARRQARVKTVQCTLCDKLFKNEEVLTNHIKIRHTGTRYNCDMCPQTFSRANGLKLHKKYLHNEEKQFECKICGIKYKWKGSLQSHEKTHENPRPHVCEVCGMSFTNKSNLNQHRTYHEDEGRDKELFKCKDCGKQLKNRKSLTKHVNAFHRPEMEKIYTCNICGKTTKTKANLRTHQKIHDPNRILVKRKENAINAAKQIIKKVSDSE